MARKRYKPEEIVSLLRQAEVLHDQGMSMADVNGGGIMLHVARLVGPVAAAQECVTHGLLSVAARGGGCTAWSFMSWPRKIGQVAKVYSTV